jgi:hypothetical protein
MSTLILTFRAAGKEPCMASDLSARDSCASASDANMAAMLTSPTNCREYFKMNHLCSSFLGGAALQRCDEPALPSKGLSRNH